MTRIAAPALADLGSFRERGEGVRAVKGRMEWAGGRAVGVGRKGVGSVKARGKRGRHWAGRQGDGVGWER